MKRFLWLVGLGVTAVLASPSLARAQHAEYDALVATPEPVRHPVALLAATPLDEAARNPADANAQQVPK
jgi:hypothetical protein